MNHSDIAALMRGAAPVIAELVAKTVQPFVDKIAALEQEIAELRSVDHAAIVADLVADAVGKLPPAAPGKDADPEETRRLVDEAVRAAVAALPPAEPGAPGEVDQEALVALVAEKVAAAVAEIPPPSAGKDADPDATAELVRVEVERAVAAIPAPEAGKSVTIEELAPLVEETVAKAVAALPPPEKGEPGAPGALPVVKAWTDDVTHEGEVRTHAGGTWQATKDTAKEPPHADWVCIAAPGAPARQVEVRGTYAPDGDYAALNIVALNGGAFIARKDDPGPCPGEDWQVIAMRGKPGEPGKKGDPGPSVKGPPGAPVVSAHIDDQGLLMLVNGDGSTVECDLYPVLAKVR